MTRNSLFALFLVAFTIGCGGENGMPDEMIDDSGDDTASLSDADADTLPVVAGGAGGDVAAGGSGGNDVAGGSGGNDVAGGTGGSVVDGGTGGTVQTGGAGGENPFAKYPKPFNELTVEDVFLSSESSLYVELLEDLGNKVYRRTGQVIESYWLWTNQNAIFGAVCTTASSPTNDRPVLAIGRTPSGAKKYEQEFQAHKQLRQEVLSQATEENTNLDYCWWPKQLLEK